MNTQYIVVKISKNEYFHSLVPYRIYENLWRPSASEWLVFMASHV
jgi:hypothetical protein